MEYLIGLYLNCHIIKNIKITQLLRSLTFKVIRKKFSGANDLFNVLRRSFKRLQYKLLIILILQKNGSFIKYQKRLMNSIYKKIIFIISAIALFFVIVNVVKYSLTYIENNPEKYLPTQK